MAPTIGPFPACFTYMYSELYDYPTVTKLSADFTIYKANFREAIILYQKTVILQKAYDNSG